MLPPAQIWRSLMLVSGSEIFAVARPVVLVVKCDLKPLLKQF
jgi:hypothetical protein